MRCGLGCGSWQASVDGKQALVAQAYNLLKGEVDIRRSTLLEVVVIVLTLGTTEHRLGLASVAALAAVVVVGTVGAVVARQLSGVPENALKAVVGVMLVSYGTFWTGEGIGVHWPGSDATILVLVAAYGAVAWVRGRVLSAERTGGERAGGVHVA